MAVTLHSPDISAPHWNKYGQEYPVENPKPLLEFSRLTEASGWPS